MAYGFVAGSSQYINSASAPVTATPLTIAARFKAAALANLNLLASLCNSSSASFFWVRNDTTGLAYAGTFTGSLNESTRGTVTANEWQTVVGVFDSNTSRTAYLNATAGTANTGSATPSGVNSVGINARWNTSWGSFATQDMAEVAIWNAGLSAAEVASYNAGFKPPRIRPQSLVFYVPLTRNLQDVRNGIALTNNNGATVANHPRIY